MSEVLEVVVYLVELALWLLIWRRKSRGEKEEEVLACLACNQKIPAEESRCPACGWTYRGASAA
jgi:hypothetical protein